MSISVLEQLLVITMALTSTLLSSRMMFLSDLTRSLSRLLRYQKGQQLALDQRLPKKRQRINLLCPDRNKSALLGGDALQKSKNKAAFIIPVVFF